MPHLSQLKQCHTSFLIQYSSRIPIYSIEKSLDACIEEVNSDQIENIREVKFCLKF